MKDILQTDDCDIDLTGGDIHYTPEGTNRAVEQIQRDIILARPGDFRMIPGRGVGLMDYVNSDFTDNPNDLFRAIRVELAGDGQKVKSITLVNGQIQVDANY